MKHTTLKWGKDFASLFYPKYCFACGRKMAGNEVMVCSECSLHLPCTDYHTYSPNPMEKLFFGRVPVEAATAYFHFKKGGGVQSLVHNLKYREHPEIGRYFGRLLGYHLAEHEILSSVDAIVPVPLHPKKQRKRGYNQSEAIAVGISDSLQKPVWNQVLARKVFTDTQTKRSTFQRWENVSEIFAVTETERIGGCHLLLVDDVVTTGATLEAAAQVLKKVEGVRVSLAALAMDMI